MSLTTRYRFALGLFLFAAVLGILMGEFLFAATLAVGARAGYLFSELRRGRNLEESPGFIRVPGELG